MAQPEQPVPTVSILIVAYNSRDFIAACLAAIPAACGNYPYEILLIDNGTDKSGEYVAAHFPHVRVVPSRGNVGFGEGNNILAAHSHPAAEYLLMLNPDTQLYPGAIAALIDVAKSNPAFAALGGIMEARADKASSVPLVALPSVHGMILGAVGLANRFAAGKVAIDDTAAVTAVEAINGGFMMLTRPIWETLGGFDDSFFLYGEDADLCHRIHQTGASIGLVPASRVHHDVGSGDFFSPVRTRFKIIANAHYANRHFGLPRRWAYKGALWVRCLARYAAGQAMGKRSPKLAAMKEAFREPALNPGSWMQGFDSEGADPRRT